MQVTMAWNKKNMYNPLRYILYMFLHLFNCLLVKCIEIVYSKCLCIYKYMYLRCSAYKEEKKTNHCYGALKSNSLLSSKYLDNKYCNNQSCKKNISHIK